jgi:hypothetical protein
MADTKISAESSASALTGSEVIPCVQGGANAKTTAGAIAALASSGIYDPIRFYQVASINPMLGNVTNREYACTGFVPTISSLSTRTFSTASFLGTLPRWGIETASGANSQAYLIGASSFAWRGNAAGRGGFVVEYMFGIESQATNGRGWFGFNSTTAWAATDSASSKTDIIGVGWDTGDTHLQLMTNDGTGTATKTDLGASFPITNNAVYRVRLTCAANGSSIDYKVDRLDSAATTSGTVSSDLPTNTQHLTFHAWCSNGGTAAQQMTNLVGMTCYSFNGQSS